MRLVLQVRGEDQDGDLKVRKLGNLDVMRLKYVEKNNIYEAAIFARK